LGQGERDLKTYEFLLILASHGKRISIETLAPASSSRMRGSNKKSKLFLRDFFSSHTSNKKMFQFFQMGIGSHLRAPSRTFAHLREEDIGGEENQALYYTLNLSEAP
jgi:hypothetical protein